MIDQSTLKKPDTVGVFRPSIPKDTQGVMRIFAIAARIICQNSEPIEEIDRQLEAVRSKLVPPESHAAKECEKLWRVFSKVALLSKANLVKEAGKAFYRDLDAICQRLDLPPMEEWEQLPLSIDEPNAIDWHHLSIVQEGQSLQSVQHAAREHTKTLKKNDVFPATEAARLLMTLEVGEQQKAFAELVGKGVMSRTEVNLLTRCLMKGEEVNESDAALVETLRRLGNWLAGR